MPFDGSQGLVVSIPVIVKARSDNADGRFIEVEASNEKVDQEGDVILQSALLKAADAFVAKGHIDIDHLSEFGPKLGIRDPTSYIIGKPVKVTDIGGGRTAVKIQLRKSIDGTFKPNLRKYDEVWDSLQSVPPVQWRASVYGYPTPDGMEKCEGGVCSNGATRYLIKGFDWRSLALTRRPVNDAITGGARIVTAKAFMDSIAKSVEQFDHEDIDGRPFLSVEDVWNHRICAKCDVHIFPTLTGYKRHFSKCNGFSDAESEVYGRALMHRVRFGA